MREIDSQPEDPRAEARLTEALRRLAASSPQAPPPEVGAGLLSEFRRHHMRRRRLRLAGFAMAASVAITAMLLTRTPSHRLPNTAIAGTPAPTISTNVPEGPAVRDAAPTRAAARRGATKTRTRATQNREFVALPAYDPGIPMDELRVVRVQLPASALWQMGAPLNSDTANRRMLADFVVGQDGTPYAVRLLQ